MCAMVHPRMKRSTVSNGDSGGNWPESLGLPAQFRTQMQHVGLRQPPQRYVLWAALLHLSEVLLRAHLTISSVAKL